MDNFTLPSHYIRQIADLLEAMGHDRVAWLAVAGLSEEALSDSGKAISYDAFQLLIDEAMRITKEPALGLLVGDRLRVTSHGMLGFAAMTSASLRQALRLLDSFVYIRFSPISTHLDVSGDEARLHFSFPDTLGDLRTPVTEAVVITVKNAIDHISMGSCEFLGVSFVHQEPEYAELAREMFNCNVAYGQDWAGIVMPATALSERLVTADPASFKQASRICQQELDKRKEQTSLAARVRRIMLESQNGFPSLSVTARMLNMTPRTLHRRLIDEGTSFHTIFDELRHSLAIQYLRNSDLTIQEVAYNVGYADPANFRRAFKRWENMSPSDYAERFRQR